MNNVLIRREYQPAHSAVGGVRERLAEEILAGDLSADEVLRRHCTLVYAAINPF